jgi:HAD superfamily hydrolase (TIGR01549 family)
VIFDVDGTLIDSTYQHAIAWHRAIVEAGLDVPVWRIHRLIGMGGDKIVAELFDGHVERRIGDHLRAEHARHFDSMRPQITPLPGAKALFERLSSDGWRLAVASSGSASDTEWAIGLVEVGHLLAATVSIDDAEASKPDPDVLAVAWRRLDADYGVVVGDSIHDIHAANEVAIPCIAVRSGGFGRDELASAGALRVENDLHDLVDLDWRRLLGIG